MSRRVDPNEALQTFRAAGLEPVGPFLGASKPWAAVHEPCGRVIAPTLANVRRRGSACRSCAAARRGAARRGELEATTIARMIKAGFTPLEPYPGASKPWRSRHERCGQVGAPRYQHVAAGGTGCRACAAEALGHQVWTAASAEGVFRSAGLTPLEPYPGSGSRAWRARHDLCGQVVSPRLGNIAAGQGPCLPCGRRAQSTTVRATTMARLDHDAIAAILLTAELEPLEPYPGGDLRWRCTHLPCGSEVSPTLSNLKRGQGGCVPCGWSKLSMRFRMPEAEAEERLRAAELDPLEPYPGSMRPWRACHRPCGREVSPTLSNVQAGRGICRYCHSDFPFAGPAQVYLVSDGLAFKIGICAPGSDRLRQHKRWGWTLCWLIDVPTGDAAWSVEQGVLRWWRNDLQAPAVYTAGDMPQLGATETVHCTGVGENETRLFAEALIAAM